jgi:hypothetical protein
MDSADAMTVNPTHSWILTHSGKRFSLANPQASQVCLEDIGHHLAQLGRFTGATLGRWSILHHEILVMMLLRKWGQPASVQLAGLHHDSPEAYVNDNNSPLKREMRDIMKQYALLSGWDFPSPYDVVENRVAIVVAQALGLPDPFPHDIVKRADLVALAMEERDWMPVPDGGEDRERLSADDWHCLTHIQKAGELVGHSGAYNDPVPVFFYLHRELHRQMIHEKMAV